MPGKPFKRCPNPGCVGLVRNEACSVCGDVRRPRQARQEAGRPWNARKWKALSRAHRTIHPLCERCEARGVIRIADLVHHTNPVKQGGRLLPSSQQLESLCHACHSVEEREARKETPKGGLPQ
jgi:5-methylcytosine-specific restriction protein A